MPEALTMYRDTITYDNADYEILLIPELDSDGCEGFAVYIQPSNHDYVLKHMFNYTLTENTQEEIEYLMEIAISEAPEHIKLWF